METDCRCHSCGTEVDTGARRCPHCYVALEAASRAPAPLRAAPSAGSVNLPPGDLSVPAAIAVEDVPLPVGVRCPSCEATVIPLTGWCSYCMDPLPVDAGTDVGEWDPDEWGLRPDLDPEPETPGGRVIAGPWPDRPVGVRYATWRQRAVATLIDAAVFVPALVALSFAGAGAGAGAAAFGAFLLVAAVAFSGWQLWHQGRSGQTIGKSQVGIFLVGEADLAPIGPRRAVLRQLAHVIDATLVGLGYLWPLWDAKHQTFADQLFATVVLAG